MAQNEGTIFYHSIQLRDLIVKDYHINVFYSEEDEAYIADIPDLTYCSAVGSTPEEAVREVQLAKTAWIEAAEAAGKPVSAPLYRPVTYQAMS